jgi:hypothetical protein
VSIRDGGAHWGEEDLGIDGKEMGFEINRVDFGWSRGGGWGWTFGTGTGGGGISELKVGKVRIGCEPGAEVGAMACSSYGDRRCDGPAAISMSTSIWKVALSSTSIRPSASKSPPPIIGKLRDPTTGDLLLSLSLIPVVERRKFSFSFLICIPVDFEPDPLTSLLDNLFMALVLSSTFTFSETPLSVCKNCVGSEGIEEAGVGVRKDADATCADGWRVRAFDVRDLGINKEFEPEVDTEGELEEPMKDGPGIGSLHICWVRWFLGATHPYYEIVITIKEINNAYICVSA